MSPTCWATGVGSASDESFLKGSENGSLLGAFDESASAPFVTLEAEITPETIDFFVNDAEGDPDCPAEGYSSIEQALHTLREGKFVIVVDDENGDIEGNLIMAASLASPQQVSFLIKNGSGIVSVGMKEEDLERLKLPLMSPETENEDSSAPTLTITVDAKSGTCTGVSASDRAKTVLALSSPETKPEDFRRPGHVFPLKYRNGLQRHYAVLQALALDEDDIPEINDETLPDEEGMARPGVVKAVEEFKLSVYGENYDEESDMGNGKASDASKKRKTAAENAAKESANYNWPDLADNGQLKDLTVTELKYYLTAHNRPVTGKKEVLISRILTHLGK